MPRIADQRVAELRAQWADEQADYAEHLINSPLLTADHLHRLAQTIRTRAADGGDRR